METLLIVISLVVLAVAITVTALVVTHRANKRQEVVDPGAKKEIEELDRLWKASQ